MSFYSDHWFDNGDGGKTDTGKCVVERWNNYRQADVPCGATASSVLHPPDQFRHWCSALEQGGDCMCYEGDEE